MALIRDRIGIYSGSNESDYDIRSTVLLPYHQKTLPLQGGFLIIEDQDLHGRPSGILGRVTMAVPIGELFGTAGEDYLVDLVRLGHDVPEEVKQGRLRYRISIRLLGQMTERKDGKIEYTPSIRKLPHVGARVGFPTPEVQQFIACGSPDGSEAAGPVIGNLALGGIEFDGRGRFPSIPVRFRMDSLIGRRTAVFARAGMGKSNFVKVLLSRLYTSGIEDLPGCIVVDPEGEYAFHNASEPGLLDVPGLRDRIVVYTDRNDYAPEYRNRVSGDCSVNFGDVDPKTVADSVLPPEKQELVFANLIRSMKQDQWRALIELLSEYGYATHRKEIARIIAGKGNVSNNADAQDWSLAAIVNNLVPPIQRLHRKESRMVRDAIEAVRQGKIVILDLSLLSSLDARLVSGWIMNSIFTNNQLSYTSHRDPKVKSAPRLVPCLAVLEEAQFYLGSTNFREDSTFVRWFKEGRKFQLGSIIVTQQPGAIGAEMISQCDNYFVFHLLSRGDLDALRSANIHYSGDVANAIGHEPIPGNCFLWSSRGLSFVTCARITPFREIVDAENTRRSAGKTATGPEVSLPVREVRP